PSLANGLLVNIMSQGGASGSPLFLQDRPEVIGIMYGSMSDTQAAVRGLKAIPTNFSFAVPANWIQKAIEAFASTSNPLIADYPEFNQLLPA
ncbi:MAG: hypothetical protein R3B46_15305, partial [Phycisphaerales bacterium]